MVLLAQFSDVHLGPLPPFRFTDLVSKRILARLNWRGSRARDFGGAGLDALVADMRARLPDQVVVTGDLVNLGSSAEFVRARAWLAALGDPADVSVVPGNHDAYVSGSLPEFRRILQPFMSDDRAVDAPVIFPFVRRRGPLALVGVSSAVSTAPLMATGKIERAEATALARVLRELGAAAAFRIVLIHHPPALAASHWHRRLIGADLFRQAIRDSGAELILHGHDHRLSIAAIPGPTGPVAVVGARAGSLAPRYERPGGSYNLIAIDARPGKFRATLTERGIRRLGAPVETLSEGRLFDQAAMVTQA